MSFSLPRRMARRWGAGSTDSGLDGKLVIVGVSAEPFAVTSLPLLLRRKSIVGWPSGTSIESEDALRFAAAHGFRPMIETFPLERAANGYDRMMSGKVSFRSVLKIRAEVPLSSADRDLKLYFGRRYLWRERPKR